MNPILLTALAIGGIGLLCGLILSLAARFFAVSEDPRIALATDCLPGANCGGCGMAGCADYAKAIIVNNAPINLCAPGGASVIKALAKLLGQEAVAVERKVAIILCGGDRDKSPDKFLYNGIADCSAAHAVGGGDKRCPHGCLGYGSCSRVCPVGAIEITASRLAVVHPERCIGCGACVRTCPRRLIRMIPDSRHLHVLCSSPDKGPVVRKVCQVGCIACTVCTKLAPDQAIAMKGALAVVDYTKPIEQEAETLVAKCPGHCIVNR